MASRTYIAVIADVIASRELPRGERTRLQDALREQLARINRRRAWRPQLAARFAVTAGDEIEGLLLTAAPLWLDQAKRERRVLVFGAFADERLDGLSAYYSALYWSWTPRQRRAAAAWRAARAPDEDLVPSAHSHLRRRMAWPLVEQGDRMFQAVLEQA